MKVDNTAKAYSLLKTYNGENNQIKYLQYKTEKTNYSLGEFEITYILNNYDYIPFEVNKIVKISSDFGEKLKEKYELDFTPEKILITKVIGEMGESYHCYIQYRKSVSPTLAYVRKNYILNPIQDNTEEVKINFTEYDNKRQLKKHQKEGIEFMLSNKKCILADSMGMGKTTQTVVAALETKCDKILIICPASLKSTWKREISIFYDNMDNVNIINGKEWKSNGKFTIVNYDILDNFYKVPEEVVYETQILEDGTEIKIPQTIKKNNGKIVEKKKKSIKKDLIKECLSKSPMFLEQFGCVIIDEAHKLSNNTSIRYKVINDFLKKSKPNYVFLLTGTPLTNKPMNLYHILKLINAEVTNDYRYYAKRYCEGKTMKLRTGKEILITNGASNLDELKEKIKHVYIRRVLSEMSDMVNKKIITKFYDLDDKQISEYNKLWDDYINAQMEQGNDDSEDYRQLVEGILVRQYLAKEMTSNTIQLVDEKLEEDEKVIIVCTFQEEVDIFKKYYGKSAVIYNGKMTAKEKDKSEHEFMNNPKIKVFIANLIAAGVGLTLTVSNFMVFNSYSWVAAENLQMQDRIYRLTQTRDVTCVYQLFNDSISQNMFNKVMTKQLIADNTIISENEK